MIKSLRLGSARAAVALAFLSVLSLAAPALGAGSMPIIAYMGPVVESMTLADYKTMSQCGFTHTINIYNNVGKAKSDMTLANNAGLKVFVHTPQLISNPAATARQLMSAPALAGYFLADEPGVNDLAGLKAKVSSIQAVDKTRPCYVNLHPYYDAAQLKFTGANTYPEYLRAASGMGLPQISFDFYPITKKGLRDNWFYTLGEIRKESLRTNKPFWGYVLSVPHNDYPQPTLAMLRLQTYVNLAYGAQAIEFFTYRTPTDKNYDFHDAPIGLDGKKTRTYTLVQSLNKELKSVVTLFYGAEIKDIGHLVKIPTGAKRLDATPVNIGKIVAKGGEGALISTFENQGRTYMAVVNKDYKSSMTLTITTKSTSVVEITKSLQTAKMKQRYTVAAGDIVIFRLK